MKAGQVPGILPRLLGKAVLAGGYAVFLVDQKNAGFVGLDLLFVVLSEAGNDDHIARID